MVFVWPHCKQRGQQQHPTILRLHHCGAYRDGIKETTQYIPSWQSRAASWWGAIHESRRGMIETHAIFVSFSTPHSRPCLPSRHSRACWIMTPGPWTRSNHKPKRSVCQIPLFGPPCVSSNVAYFAAACFFAINAHNCYSISFQLSQRPYHFKLRRSVPGHQLTLH